MTQREGGAMTIPTQEDFLSAASKWRGEHRGIAYELSWHGRSDYNKQGTWCYYIIVTEQQFYPDDWKRLRLSRQDRKFHIGGSWHRHYDYDSFPDLEPHGGWTFGEMDVFLGRDGKQYESVKVGCDYAHHWDEEGGYWHGRADVERDAKRSIDLLHKMFPNRRERCGYSGRYDDADKFYTAINGQRVHVDCKEKLKETGWEQWLPVSDGIMAMHDQTVAMLKGGAS